MMKCEVTIGLLTALWCASMVTALTDAELQEFKDDGLAVSVDGMYHIIQSTGEPQHNVPTYPNGNNPNAISVQNYIFDIPQTSTELQQDGCLPMGIIGVMKNGVPIFNPYTIEGYNAVEGNRAETFDSCDGHPDPQGRYHYHRIATCLNTNTPNSGLIRDEFVGVALDGYPIYGPKTADGTILTSSNLDACHGRTVNGNYRYHMTSDFPYYLGCYKGYVDPSKIPGGTPRDCYYANVAQPANGRTSLTSGTINNGEAGGAGAVFTQPLLIVPASILVLHKALCFHYYFY